MIIPWQYIILVFIAIWIASMLRCLRFSRLGKMVNRAKATPAQDTLMGMSIIITAHDQQEQLRRHLPLFLEQDYAGLYEVIVVDMASKDDTRLVMENMQKRYPNLHVTALPTTARDISQHRMAITLGMRAASHEWVVITQADCCPASSSWLSHMARCCQQSDQLQLVAGYTRLVQTRGWNGLRRRFLRLYDLMVSLPLATSYRLYQSESTNLCYRRSAFLAHRGFASHANLIAGATEIMVNHESTRANTALCLHPESFMLQDCPEGRLWDQERIFHVETSKHFTHWVLYRLLHGLGVWTDRIYRLGLVAALALELVTQQWIPAGIIGLLWLIHLIFRSYEWHRTTSAMGERSMHLMLPLLLALVPWWDNSAWWQWLFTKKKTFRKKFV